MNRVRNARSSFVAHSDAPKNRRAYNKAARRYSRGVLRAAVAGY